ncbi:MAG: hypothetical protein OXI77_16950 [Chloroflexota bacterium]|nr:hypothetical protein [Chloroflexota bacterium]MDE2911229.1 hypothetical protein [Chloroflexota bacterium]
MKIQSSASARSLDEIALFPFDDGAIPLQRGVQLHLNGHRATCGRTRIVLAPGPEGAPDSEHVAYYGTVIRIGDLLWMWYLGQGAEQTWFQRVHLAFSRDGYKWDKPNLGLVKYKGSRDNNLVDMGDAGHIAACVVFHDPADPDESRRFKMAFEDQRYGNRFAVAFSPDGLRWTESPANPVGPWFEMSGGSKIDDMYVLAGQGGAHIPDLFRQFASHVSYDFENWSLASCLGLQRSDVAPRPRVLGGDAGEQIHLGAGLWNRGNIIIGFYGMWNGHPANDRRMTTMDLGLAFSNDGLRYREPIPNFPIVSAAEDGWAKPPRGDQLLNFPTLIQGQGFENVGDETLFWYGPWPEQKSDGVRIASWPRDRLGCFRAYMGGPLASEAEREPHIISAPIDLEGKAARLYLNLDCVHEHSSLSIEILDERLHPLPGYLRENCDAPTETGYNQLVTWGGGDAIARLSGRIRIRVDFTGVRPEDVRLYAMYLREAK